VQQDVNCFSFLASFLGFALSFSIICLIPYDVWAALSSHDESQRTGTNVILNWTWNSVYWVTFILCWFLCPVLIAYETAGDFTPVGRLRASLRQNAIWYTSYLVVGCVVVLWLTIEGHEYGGISAWCIAASNAWGLLMSTVLMGYGLVAVPRHFWRLANPGERSPNCAVQQSPWTKQD